MVNPLVIDPWIWKNPGPFRVGNAKVSGTFPDKAHHPYTVVDTLVFPVKPVPCFHAAIANRLSAKPDVRTAPTERISKSLLFAASNAVRFRFANQ